MSIPTWVIVACAFVVFFFLWHFFLAVRSLLGNCRMRN